MMNSVATAIETVFETGRMKMLDTSFAVYLTS